MKPKRPVNYLCWLKRLNCEPAAIARTTYYRMRLNMGLVNRRTVVGQMRAQNESIRRHPNTNNGNQLFKYPAANEPKFIAQLTSSLLSYN